MLGHWVWDLWRDWDSSPPQIPGTHSEMTRLYHDVLCHHSLEQRDQDIINWILWKWIQLKQLSMCFVYLRYLSQRWRARNQRCRERMCVSEVVRSGGHFNTKQIRIRVAGLSFSSEMCGEKKKRCFVKTYSNEQEKKCEPQLNNYFINASVGLGNYSEDISLFTMLWRLSMAGRCLLGRPCLWGIWQKARWGSCLGVK